MQAGAYLTVETSQACGALTSARAIPALKSAKRLTAKPRGLRIAGAHAGANAEGSAESEEEEETDGNGAAMAALRADYLITDSLCMYARLR